MSTRARRPPGPRGPAKWGALLRARRDPVRFLEGLRDRHGDVAFFRVGPAGFYVVSHPEHAMALFERRSDLYRKSAGERKTAARLLGRGLLASEGDLHRHQRQVLEPLMAPRAVVRFAGVAVDFAGRMAARWQDGSTIDVERDMNELTHGVVIRALFGVDIDDPRRGPLPDALSEAADAYSRLPLPFSDLAGRLPLPANLRFRRARARLDAVLAELIAARRVDDADDLLGDLVRSGLSDRQVRDEAVTLFLPGRKPLATALTWACYLLAGNPEAEARFHAEVDRVLDGRERPTAGDLPELRYTRAVLAETLRLFPPAWIVLRKAVREHAIGSYRVPPGASVVASHRVVHHDSRFHRDPERFEPERWLSGDETTLTAFSWFPFGGGERRCIGEAFAWMEGTLALATIGRRWRMRLASGHRVEPSYRVTLLPRHGMRMVLHRRNAQDRAAGERAGEP